ncbi:hypothetical protein PUN28_006618 [Cardiocondyla obscurior]|uniref:Ribosomal protein S14 n=1 Tax=Cardiocondyla obscurior TaxID=286306 RepID=A0AAW2GEN0_9HYME
MRSSEWQFRGNHRASLAENIPERDLLRMKRIKASIIYVYEIHARPIARYMYTLCVCSFKRFAFLSVRSGTGRRDLPVRPRRGRLRGAMHTIPGIRATCDKVLHTPRRDARRRDGDDGGCNRSSATSSRRMCTA